MARKDVLPTVTPLVEGRTFTINGWRCIDNVTRNWNHAARARTGRLTSAIRRIDNADNGMIVAWLDYTPENGWSYMFGESHVLTRNDRRLQTFIAMSIGRMT